MHKRKWLIIVVAVLLLLNLLYIVIPRLFDIKAYLGRVLTEKIGKKLNAKISFSGFNFTTKFIQISELKIDDEKGEYCFSAKQIYFRYSFWSLIIHPHKFPQAIRKIRCYSPNILYKFQHSKEKPFFQFSDIEKTLKKLSYFAIINGEIQIKSRQKNLAFDERLNCINLKLQKKWGKWKIDFTANHTPDKGKISLSGIYKKDKSDIDVKLDNLNVSQIIVNNVKLINGRVNLDLPVRKGKIENGLLSIDSLFVDIENQPVFLKKTDIKLTNKQLEFVRETAIKWQDCKISLNGKILDYLSKNPEFDLGITSDGIKLNNFNKKITGYVHLTGKMKSNLHNPKIELNLTSPEFTISSQKVKSFSTRISYQNQKIKFLSGNFVYQNNSVSFLGSISPDFKNIKASELAMKFSATKFQYNVKNTKVGGNLAIKVSGKFQNPELIAYISDIGLPEPVPDLNHLGGTINFFDNKLSFNFKNSDKTILVSGKGTNLLESQSRYIGIKLRSYDFPLNKLWRKKSKWLNEFQPNVNAEINACINSNKLLWKGSLDFQKHPLSQVTGKIISNGNLSFRNVSKNGSIQLYSEGLKIQNQEYKIDCLAETEADTIFLKRFAIDNAILLDGKLKLSTGSKNLAYYQGRLKITNLPIAKVANMFFLSEKSRKILGSINGEANFVSEYEKPISGKIWINGFTFNGKIKPINTYLTFGLKDSVFDFADIRVFNNEKNLFDGKAKIGLGKKNLLNFYAHGKSINIQDDIFTGPLQGIGDYEILGTGTLQEPRILCNLNLQNGKIFNTKFDTCSIQFFQDKGIFNLNHFNIVRKKQFKVLASGTYSYNFFKKEFSDKPGIVNLNAEGDFLSLIGKYLPSIKQASSTAELNLTFVTKDKRAIWESGKLIIKDGEMEIKGQPEKIRKININTTLKNNQIDISKCSLKIGNGKLFVSNGFKNKSHNIKIGGLNLGTILLYTSKQGVSLHFPAYMPERAVADLVLTGFEDKYFRIFNIDDAWKLSGKILISNGKALFPPKKTGTTEIRFGALPPIKFNIDLVFQKNIWYVTNPFHVCIDHSDLIQLRTNPDNGNIDVYLNLHSHQGEMQLFGETFQVDHIEVKKSKFDKLPRVNAIFCKKTPDGSTISLKIISTEDVYGSNIRSTEYGNFKITLTSDNPRDVTVLGILSKLQYGKSVGELTEEERKNLYREGAIKIASDELGNMLFGTILTPVESTIRQFLGLDFFRLKTGFMGNIMKKSGLVLSEENLSQKSETESKFEHISELSKEIILEDLSVAMGKYITPNWYVNYEALIQKELTQEHAVKIGVQHEISFRYDLPFNLRLTYLYRFSPLKEEETQRISLETVINF